MTVDPQVALARQKVRALLRSGNPAKRDEARRMIGLVKVNPVDHGPPRPQRRPRKLRVHGRS